MTWTVTEMTSIVLNSNFPWSIAIIIFFYLLGKSRNLLTSIQGTIVNLVGYYLVLIGVSLSEYTLQPISKLIYRCFGVNGGVMNSELYAGHLLVQYAIPASFTLLLAFGINLLIARHTRHRNVYLTAHHMLYLCLFSVFILKTQTALPMLIIILISAVFTGIWMYCTVLLTSIPMQKITETNNTGMANSCASAAFIGAATKYVFNGKSNTFDTDDGHINDQSNAVPIYAFLGILVLYITLFLILGPDKAKETIGVDGSWFYICASRALLYGAQYALLLNGIRRLMANLVRMLWDLASRFVTNFGIGLDATALIPYSPPAWSCGFKWCTLGGLIASILMLVLQVSFVPLLSLTSYYFCGGVAGICGNAYNGKRGARLSGLIAGFISTVLIGLMMSGLTDMTQLGICFGETEYGLFGIILQLLCKIFN